MKGDLKYGLLVTLLIAIVFVALIIGNFIPMIASFSSEKYEGLERLVGSPGTIEPYAPTIIPMGPLIDYALERKISQYPDSFYASELGCIIAEDIYKDFTSYGENGRNLGTYLTYANAYDQNFHCEWIWDEPCCPEQKKLPENLLVGGYKCLIDSGIFAVRKNDVLTNSDINDLDGFDCSPCTNAVNREYELDEVCVNVNLGELKFPESSDISFCTDDVPVEEVLMIDYGEIERQKFGNSHDEISTPFNYYGCYVNPNNDDDAWRDDCKLCIAAGTRDDDSDLTERDYDRIHSWKADYSYNFYTSNDKSFKENGGIIPGKKYVYTLYWNDHEDEDIISSKGYEIEFPSFINTEYTQIEKGPLTKTTFLNFLTEFFDETDDVRNSAAGAWFSELRTEFDGIVTLQEEVTLNEIQNELVVETNSFGYLVPCYPGRNCNNPVKPYVWAESVVGDGPQFSNFYFDDISPIFIRHSYDIVDESKMKTENQDNEQTKYRIIVRNWVSNWYDWEKETCDKYWCMDEDRIAGEKIYCGDMDTGCQRADLVPGPGGLGADKEIFLRYVDKSITIIRLNDCEDSDGVDFDQKGQVTLNDDDPDTDPDIYEDECVNSGRVTEKVCYFGGVADIPYDCPAGCSDGVCDPTSDFDYRISLDSHFGVLCQDGPSIQVTVDVDKISGSNTVIGLSELGVPSGIVSFAPDSGSGDYQSTMTINPSSSTPPGEYYIKVQGKDAADTYVRESEYFRLVITEPKYSCSFSGCGFAWCWPSTGCKVSNIYNSTEKLCCNSGIGCDKNSCASCQPSSACGCPQVS